MTEASLTYRTAAELAVVLKDAGAEVRLTATSRSALDLDLDQRNPAAEPPLIRPVDARLADDPTTVVMSGRADPSWLHRRAGLASGADVFVSLHYDVRPRSSERGALVLVDRRTRPAPACARATARRLAADLRGGTLRPRTLGVLSPDHNPVAQRYLVEIGVLTNRVERRLMQQSRWRWRTARLLAWAIVDCRRAVARSKAAASESAVSRNARAAGAGRPASRTAGRTMTRSPT